MVRLNPKVRRIMAFWAIVRCFEAIFLPTLGGQVRVKVYRKTSSLSDGILRKDVATQECSLRRVLNLEATMIFAS